MELTSVQQTAGRRAPAGAPRQSLGSASGTARSHSVSCSWPAAASLKSAALAPIAAFATKPATRMYVDVPNHRTRRLREPSP